MLYRTSGAFVLTRVFSVVVGLSLAVLATIGATVDQRPQGGCDAALSCCAACDSGEARKMGEAGKGGDGSVVPIFCFDPDRLPSAEIMDWINSLYDAESDYVLFNSHWGTGAGSPVTLRWSFVPDGTLVPGLGGQSPAPSTLFATMNQRFNNNQALWISLFEQSFDRWSELTGVNFVRVSTAGNEWDDGALFPNVSGANPAGASGSSVRGDFRIGMRVLDGQGGVLAFNFLPTVSDMVMDAADNWASGAPHYRFMRNVVMHEIGHGLGLAHCCPINQSKLMEPTVTTAYDGPQHDDVRGVHARYGDAYEPNDGIGIATDLGPLNVGQTFLPSVPPAPNFSNSSLTSIDRIQDNDYFRFTTTEAINLNVKVSPIGHSYSSGPQQQGGSCPTGPTVNSLTQAALAVQVFGPNTQTLLSTSNSQPAGSIETIDDLFLTEPGNYFVRVFATSATGPQLYRLEIAATSGAGTCPTFSQQPTGATLCEGGQFQFTVQASGAPAPTFQWRRNQVPIQGATSNIYQIPVIDASHAGTYDCIVTNTCGFETSNAAILNVNTKPVITGHPEPQDVALGEQASFTATATASSTPSFRWYRNNVLIPGGTNGTLIIPSVTENDAGTYYAEALAPCGATPTTEAMLTIKSSCYANCDNSTTEPILNVDDFTCFINAFAAAQALPHEEQITHYANCDNSTTAPVLNVDDFTCFINEFAQGCP